MSTADGPAGIGTLEQVAKAFTPDDQQIVLDQIGGFNQRVQKAIIQESGGDPDKIQPLSDLALEGAFDVRTCSELLCFDMPEEMKRRVREQLSETNS